MSGLFGALNNSVEALQAFETALGVSQNNVSNATTPGYARQIATLEAQGFDPANGIDGGVKAGATQSTQDEYVNQSVRNQLAAQGGFNAQSNALQSIQALFDVSGQTGVIGALNNLFQSFSAWSSSPSSTLARQDVLAKAQAAAQSFQSTASSLSQTTTQINQQISTTVQQINNIAADILNDNLAIQQGAKNDAGLDARLHASLESLSQLADVTVSYASDGTATVLLAGQGALVIGAQQYTLHADFSPTGTPVNPAAIPDARIVDSDGHDVSGFISQGVLGGLLSVRNTVLPALQGNGQQQGALNQLAQQVADRVNQILAAGQTGAGAAGGPLFAYNNATPVDIARTLTLDPNITPAGLAAIDPGPPSVDNGTALQLSNLGNSTNAADQISGQTILQFLNAMAAQAGQQASDAQSGNDLHTQLLAQARSLQTQVSGVSLDAEAIKVMELQKGYEAAGKMVSVIDGLTNTLINMIT